MNTQAEWTAWEGKGPRPVMPWAEVEFRCRDGYTGQGEASELEWAHIDHESDITAYRIIKE